MEKFFPILAKYNQPTNISSPKHPVLNPDSCWDLQHIFSPLHSLISHWGYFGLPGLIFSTVHLRPTKAAHRMKPAGCRKLSSTRRDQRTWKLCNEVILKATLPVNICKRPSATHPGVRMDKLRSYKTRKSCGLFRARCPQRVLGEML